MIPEYKNICFVKTGWSERYQGGPVYGRHGYLKNNNGHEALNFMPGPDGSYYIYAPPHSTPENTTNWLVILVAAGTKNNGKSFGPIEPVGWLEDATFVAETKRPEYSIDKNYPTSSDGTPFSYCLTAKRAFLIPPDLRSIPLPEKHGRKLGMGAVFVVREDGITKRGDQWRKDYADYALKLVRRFPFDSEQVGVDTDAVTDPAALALDPTNTGYPTAEHRRKVEKAAEAFAEAYFKNDYKVNPVMSENRGYDFHLTKRTGEGEILLEVKGTSGQESIFYFTPNEMRCLERNSDIYRIFVVTSALSKAPQRRLIAPEEMKKLFSFQPLAWVVRPL